MNHLVRISAELLEFSPETQEQIAKQEYFFMSIDPTPNLLQPDSLSGTYWFLSRMVRRTHLPSTVIEDDRGIHLIVPANSRQPPSLGPWGNYTDQTQRGLEIEKEVDRMALSRLMYAEFRDSLTEQGYKIRRNGACKIEEDLTAEIPSSTNLFLSKIQQSIHAYPGFGFAIRYLDSKLFLQLQPRSFVDFDKDVFSLLNDGVLTADEVTSRLNDVYVPGIGGAHLLGFLDAKASDSLEPSPFNGKSFVEYSKTMFPNLPFTKPNAQMLVVAPRYGEPAFYSAEHVRPIVSFPRIAGLDQTYFAKLTGKMKAYSASRREVLNELLKTLKMSYLGNELLFKGLMFHESDFPEVVPDEIETAVRLPEVFKFQRPPLTFSDRNTGKPREVPYGGGFFAAPTDLLHHSDILGPLDAPTEIKLLVVCIDNLAAETKTLLERLNNGYSRFGGAVKDFRCRFEWERGFRTITGFEDVKSALEGVSSNEFDCALLIGPRAIGDDLEKTRTIYLQMETQCLEKGIPAQYIANDPNPRPEYDRSVKTKATQPDTLFGIAQNVLGKVGARVFELAHSSTKHFLADSVVLGYNVIRIFVPPASAELASPDPRKAVRRSIPVIAPLVLMTNKGSEIIMQNVHLMQEETDLFTAEHAPDILEGIPSDARRLIIHKDGIFYPQELSDIRKLQSADRQLIPVSIVTGGVPRLFSSISDFRFLPHSGTVFATSQNGYLLVSTLLTSRYLPEQKGWPNPIWITIHDEVLSSRLNAQDKLKIVYQIWALTKANPGSQLPIRRPLSIHYSNKIGTFLRKAGDPRPGFLNRFQKNRNRLGYVPRIFL